MLMKSLPATTPVAQSVCCLMTVGRPPPPPLLSARTIRGICSAVPEKRRCSPTDFCSVGADADVPGPNSGVHGLVCVDREGGLQAPKVVLQTRVVIRLLVAYAVTLPGRLGVFGRRRLRGSLPAWVFGFWSCCLPLVGVSPCFSCRSLLSLFRVVLFGLIGASVAPGPLVLGRAGLRRFSLVFMYLGRFCGMFRSCGVPARWRDLRHVVLTFAASSFPSWRVASEFFWSSQLLIQEAAERRGLHVDRAERWSNGILGRLSSLGKVGGREVSGVRGVWCLFVVGTCRP